MMITNLADLTEIHKGSSFAPHNAGNWECLLACLGKEKIDQDPINMLHVLESMGLRYAVLSLWAGDIEGVAMPNDNDKEELKALGADYVGSPERVSDAQRTAVQTFACRCAHYFLDAFEQECPGDMRPRQAIEAAERFIRGEITRDALHAAAMLSYKAAEACHGDGTNAAINALRVFEITAETWVGIALAKNIEEASEAAREYFTQEFRDLCNLRGSYKLSLEDLADSSMKLSTTLNALQEVPFDRAVYVDKHTHNFESLLGALGKTKADDEELPCERIMDLIGLNNAVCALNAVDGHHNAKRLFSCYCAKYVLDLFERKYPDDKRPREAIATSERFARGQAGVEELDVAMSAAAAAREDAEDAVISPGTLSNRDLDAAWAALHAARAAELTVDAALAAGAVEWGADQDIHPAMHAVSAVSWAADSNEARKERDGALDVLAAEFTRLCRLEGEYGEVDRPSDEEDDSPSP